MKNIKIYSFYFLLIFLLLSCKSYRIDRYLRYDINCLNCGLSSDGILLMDMIKSIHEDSTVFIKITNLSDETVILNDKFFTGSMDGQIIMFPIGYYNPYLKYNYTYLRLEAESKPVYSYSLKYIGDIHEQRGSSTNYEYEATTPIPLPPKATLTYLVKNFPLSLYKDRIQLETKIDYESYAYKIDWNSINNYTKLMSQNTFGFHIVYRKINENIWRNFDLLYKPTNLDIIQLKKVVK